MIAVRQAHELRRFARVLIHRDSRGSAVATIIAVTDAAYAGLDLVDVHYRWSPREAARKVRVNRATWFPYLGGGDPNDFAAGMIAEMEAQYRCRYEAPVTQPAGLHCFPVTHRLTTHLKAAWAHVGIHNFEALNWEILDANGGVLVHGSEQNFPRTSAGYRRMIRRALTVVRCYGDARRVYPRRAEDRKVAARVHGRDGYTGAQW